MEKSWEINVEKEGHPVGRICFCGAGHEKRRGEQLKWSLAFSLYIESFPCEQLPPVHRARLGRMCFSVYPRALPASTIAWVRSYFHPFWAVVNKTQVKGVNMSLALHY